MAQQATQRTTEVMYDAIRRACGLQAGAVPWDGLVAAAGRPGSGIAGAWVGQEAVDHGVGLLERSCRHGLERVTRTYGYFMTRGSLGLSRRLVSRGVGLRSVAASYPAEFLACPLRALGELLISATVPLSLALVDRRIAVLVGEMADGAPVLVAATDRQVLSAAKRYVDQLAELSVPVQPAWRQVGIDPTHRQVRMMALMARGLTDEAVGRELDVTSRTVRSEVARLADAFEVSSRFELGLVWARWLSRTNADR